MCIRDSVGSAPDVTKNFIELRGIGIVDVKSMFGVQSVRETQNIDLVITLEDWSREKEYDRLGLEEEYTEFLGNKVVCHSIPCLLYTSRQASSSQMQFPAMLTPISVGDL